MAAPEEKQFELVILTQEGPLKLTPQVSQQLSTISSIADQAIKAKSSVELSAPKQYIQWVLDWMAIGMPAMRLNQVDITKKLPDYFDAAEWTWFEKLTDAQILAIACVAESLSISGLIKKLGFIVAVKTLNNSFSTC
jgi:hypothetical protein